MDSRLPQLIEELKNHSHLTLDSALSTFALKSCRRRAPTTVVFVPSLLAVLDDSTLLLHHQSRLLIYPPLSTPTLSKMIEMVHLDIKSSEKLIHQPLGKQGGKHVFLEVFDLDFHHISCFREISNSPHVDLIIRKLSEFAEKCYAPANDHHDRAAIEALMSSYSIDEAGLKEVILDRLQSTLPVLKSQFGALSQLLNPSCLLQQTEAKIERVMQLQVELERTIDHINSDIALVCAKSAYKARQSNDQDLGRIKIYRLDCLKANFLKVSEKIGRFFLLANDLLKSINEDLSPDKSKLRTPAPGVLAGHRDTHEQADHLIDSTIETIMNSTNPGTRSDLAQSDYMPSGKFAQEPTVCLAELMIPIMKLSRLFFKKISIRGVNTKRLPLSTKMCTNEILSVAKSLGEMVSDLLSMTYLLHAFDVPGRAPNYNSFIAVTERLNSRFEASVRVALLHLVPSIPDTDGSPLQNYYRSWIVNWNTQRLFAVDNLSRYARSVDGNQS
ncbi:hypothetical protein MJO28_003896 [Puccinia striiformis f. sp. tritici]|uniref:Uncharacterized protein n=1 Tax=Puccinia striiformis f. sp. tritici TaxID=168172 RepID=A0ACC0EMW1_9BASI|nr:hypothetical protein MJO28_003896 [Puccinia striiformis f. sp. tritici]